MTRPAVNMPFNRGCVGTLERNAQRSLKANYEILPGLLAETHQQSLPVTVTSALCPTSQNHKRKRTLRIYKQTELFHYQNAKSLKYCEWPVNRRFTFAIRTFGNLMSGRGNCFWDCKSVNILNFMSEQSSH